MTFHLVKKYKQFNYQLLDSFCKIRNGFIDINFLSITFSFLNADNLMK